jgi:hypothetical protein
MGMVRRTDDEICHSAQPTAKQQLLQIQSTGRLYAIVRITQMGKNSAGMDVFNLNGVEFDGELKYNCVW